MSPDPATTPPAGARATADRQVTMGARLASMLSAGGSGRGGSSWVYRLVAIAVCLLIAAVYLSFALHGVGTLGSVMKQTFATKSGIQELVVLATPFFLTGLAVNIPLRLGLWNIGGEGQLFAGAWLGAAFVFYLPGLPGFFAIVGAIVAGAVGGCIWTIVPAAAKVYLNVNEIITTLMLNFVVILWVSFWITGAWRYPNTQGGTIESKFIPQQSHLPLIPVAGGLDSGILIAVGLTICVGLALRYSVFGYRMLVIGSGSRIARYSGVKVARVSTAALLAGGALAGVAGALQLIGNSYQLTPGISNNTGYLGIAVAVLAGGSVLGLGLMAILLAIILSAGQIAQVYGVSSEAVFIIIGLLLILSVFATILHRARARHVSRTALRGNRSRADGGIVTGHGAGSRQDVGSAVDLPAAAPDGATEAQRG